MCAWVCICMCACVYVYVWDGVRTYACGLRVYVLSC